MVRSRTLLTSLALTALVACEQPTTVGVDVEPQSITAIDNVGNFVQQAAAEQLVTGTTKAAGPISKVAIPYGSFSGTVIDFDGLAGNPVNGSGEILGAQFAGSGVTFDVPNFNAYATTGALASTSANSDPNVIWVNQGGGSGGASSVGMNINFASPVSQVGLLVITSFNSTATLTIYDGATLLEALTVTLPASPDGFGLEGFLALSNTNITRAVISSRSNFLGQNWNFVLDDLKFASSVLEIGIDIKPGSDPNSINTKSGGNIPVAVLGSATFDVDDIDRTTLAFGPNGAAPAHVAGGHVEDVNDDGFDDLVSHYATQETGLAPGDTGACVTGETIGGGAFEGCDAVNIVR